MTDLKTKHSNTGKYLLVLFLAVILWMSIWELIGILTETWKQEHRIVFYACSLAISVAVLLLQPHLLPHLN
jgi:hypothetical protein